jgi:hypothetical protein
MEKEEGRGKGEGRPENLLMIRELGRGLEKERGGKDRKREGKRGGGKEKGRGNPGNLPEVRGPDQGSEKGRVEV